MSHDHREAIAAFLDRHLSDRDFEQGCRLACGYDGDDRSTHLADALLGSDVLAQIRAEVRAEALREVADKWQQGGWTLLKPPLRSLSASAPQRIIGAAQAVTDWLRARAEGSA